MYKPLEIKRSSKYGNNYWETYSPKARRIVRLFSDLEYDNYILMETNADIVEFCEQPLKIKQQVNNDLVESIPDIWIKRSDGSEVFLEVKYSSELDTNNPKSTRSIRQINAQRLWCKENGFNHIIHTEKEIRGNGILLSNMKIVLSFIRRRLNPIEIDREHIIKAITNKITIADIRNQFSNLLSERVDESICWMFYHGLINANFDVVPFGKQTEVWKSAK